MTGTSATGRRRFLALACAWTAFVVYGSLVPLHYQPVAFGDALHQIQNLPALWVGLGTRADWVANILLFIPLTFCWMGALVAGRASTARLISSIALVPVAFAAAVAMEFAQIWFPGRTVSRNDILAETIGGAIGVVAWWAIGRDLTLWLLDRSGRRQPHAALRRAIEAYMVGFAFFELIPLDLSISLTELAHKITGGGVTLIPFTHGYADPVSALTKFLGDTATFLPVGAWVVLVRPFRLRLRSEWMTGAVGTAVMALALEVAQFFVLSRFTDVTDVVLASLGGGTGAWMASRIGVVQVAEPDADAAPLPARVVPALAGLIAYSVLLTASFWYPFDVTRSRSQIRLRADQFFQLPFAANDGGPVSHVFSQAAVRLLLFAPVGGLVAYVAARSPRDWVRRTVSTAGLFYGASLALAIEAGQVLLPSHVASAAEIPISVAGICLGFALVRHLIGPRVRSPIEADVAKATQVAHVAVGVPSAFPRGWCAAFACGAAAFAIYISLVPFHFAALPAGETLANTLRQASAGWRINGGSNFVANALMFVPIGLFGLAALTPSARSFVRLVVASLAVFAVALAISISIETAQAFLPGRTPSMADVAAQALGCLGGLALWWALAPTLRVFLASIASGHRGALETCLWIYAGLQMWRMLEPFRLVSSAAALREKIVLWPWQSPVLRNEPVTTMVAAAVFAAPVGVLCLIAGHRLMRRQTVVLGLGAVVSFYLAVEVAQAAIVSRTADSVEWLANVAGGVAGVLLTAAVVGSSGDVRAARRLALLGFAGATGLYLVYQLAPFQFVFSREMLLVRGWRLVDVPFHGYYVNPEFKALNEILIKSALGLPFGILSGWWSRGDPPDRVRRSRRLALLGTAMFFAVCEFLQVFLPSRFPDGTDVLLATAGAWVGLRLAQTFDGVLERT